MKQIHFFGCSFTAGDELSDSQWFPWKSEIRSAQEYYRKRAECNIDNDLYQEANKAMAYPAMLNGINHASNGMSLKECMLRIVELINSDCQIDAIYLQLPPFLRELFITEDKTITSLRFNTTDTTLAKSYIESKILTHDKINFAVNDALELISFVSFMKSKNINFSLISFGHELMLRQRELNNDSFKFLFNELQQLKMLDFSEYAYRELYKIRSLGGHFTLEAHTYFAKVIKQHLADEFLIFLD